jgi:hypothetical protein
MSNTRIVWVAWCILWAFGWLLLGFAFFALWIFVPASLVCIWIPVGLERRPTQPGGYQNMPPPTSQPPYPGYRPQPPPAERAQPQPQDGAHSQSDGPMQGNDAERSQNFPAR